MLAPEAAAAVLDSLTQQTHVRQRGGGDETNLFISWNPIVTGWAQLKKTWF
jgi:hypothetical protein